MSAQPIPSKMSEEEYLAFERASEFKNEYADGQLIPMQAENLQHNLICSYTQTALIQALGDKDCFVLALRIKLKILATARYAYPDILVISGQPAFIDTEREIVINPTLIIEVLSPSTESEDRGKKLREYRQIESLQEYLLISQDSPRIERYMRPKEGSDWLYSDVSGIESSIKLASLELSLALADVYKKVEFPEESSQP